MHTHGLDDKAVPARSTRSKRAADVGLGARARTGARAQTSFSRKASALRRAGMFISLVDSQLVDPKYGPHRLALELIERHRQQVAGR